MEEDVINQRTSSYSSFTFKIRFSKIGHDMQRITTVEITTYGIQRVKTIGVYEKTIKKIQVCLLTPYAHQIRLFHI